jgi:hypothetical protein
MVHVEDQEQNTAQNLAEEKRKEKERKYAEDLRWIMSDPRGRRFMWDLLARTRLYQLSHVDGSFDKTAFNEGQRNVGLSYLADIERLTPERYEKMVEEQRK